MIRSRTLYTRVLSILALALVAIVGCQQSSWQQLAKPPDKPIHIVSNVGGVRVQTESGAFYLCAPQDCKPVTFAMPASGVSRVFTTLFYQDKDLLIVQGKDGRIYVCKFDGCEPKDWLVPQQGNIVAAYYGGTVKGGYFLIADGNTAQAYFCDAAKCSPGVLDGVRFAAPLSQTPPLPPGDVRERFVLDYSPPEGSGQSQILLMEDGTMWSWHGARR